MTEQLDLDEVLARNPQIDRSKVGRLRESLRSLRQQRPLRRGEEIEPLGGRRIVVRDGADEHADPRVIRLRRVHAAE